MPFNKLLDRQIKKHLPPELASDERLMRFLEAVRDSYKALKKTRHWRTMPFTSTKKNMSGSIKNYRQRSSAGDRR
jgi:hypothetical protein